MLDSHFPVLCFYFRNFPREDAALGAVDSQTKGRCFAENKLRQGFLIAGRSDDRQQGPGPVLLHEDRRQCDVQRAAFEQPLHGVTQNLRVRVVDIRFDDGDRGGFRRLLHLPDEHA